MSDELNIINQNTHTITIFNPLKDYFSSTYIFLSIYSRHLELLFTRKCSPITL